MTAAPACPFCETQTTRRAQHSLLGMVEIYDCPSCKAHLHRPFIQETAAKPIGNAAKVAPALQGATPNECPECAFGDAICHQCGDTVCTQHERRASSVANALSPELRDHMLERYSNQIFCPLCFQGKIMRLSREVVHGSGGKNRPKKLFNMPLILILFALVFLITLGPKRCVAEHALQQDQPQHEPTSGNP